MKRKWLFSPAFHEEVPTALHRCTGTALCPMFALEKAQIGDNFRSYLVRANLSCNELRYLVLTFTDHLDIEDETVPFYSLVMDTLLESTFSPINRSSSPSDLLLQTLECGASLQFSLFSSSPYDLKNTLYSSWYGSSASDWQQTLCEYDAILRNVYAQIGEASMVHHQKVASNVFETRWSNGKRLLVNYADTAYVMDGQTVPARGWLVI